MDNETIKVYVNTIIVIQWFYLLTTCWQCLISDELFIAQAYARAAEFGILREESEEVLTKAVKWLGKKIQEARNDPSVSFGDFTEYFITLEVS